MKRIQINQIDKAHTDEIMRRLKQNRQEIGLDYWSKMRQVEPKYFLISEREILAYFLEFSSRSELPEQSDTSICSRCYFSRVSSSRKVIWQTGESWKAAATVVGRTGKTNSGL